MPLYKNCQEYKYALFKQTVLEELNTLNSENICQAPVIVVFYNHQ